MVSSSLNLSPSSPRENSNAQPPYLKSSLPPGSSMTPSSDTNSVTMMRPISGLASVVEVEHAVVVGLAGGERELPGCGVVSEQPRQAGPAGERVDAQMELVDEAVGEHRVDERDAPAHVEVSDLVLQAADGLGVVRPDDLRVAPRRVRQRSRDDVLRRDVEEQRTGVLLHGPRRPRRL